MASFRTMSSPKLVAEHRKLATEFTRLLLLDKPILPQLQRALDQAEEELNRRHLDVTPRGF